MAKLFNKSNKRIQCQDIKLATSKVVWKDQDHFASFKTKIQKV